MVGLVFGMDAARDAGGVSCFAGYGGADLDLAGHRVGLGKMGVGIHWLSLGFWRALLPESVE